MAKQLFSSHTPFEKCYQIGNVKQLSFIPGNRNLKIAHVRSIFKSFLNGEWIPPIFVTSEGEVLDGQHRIAAFRMLKEKCPNNKSTLSVLVVNAGESALHTAIKFNSGHANWVIEDYMRAYLEKQIHGYEQLRDFVKAYPEFELKAAVQLIKGKHSTKDFKEGALKISNEEYVEATKKAGALYLISEKLNTKLVFRRDIVLAFYRMYDKIPNIHTYLKKMSNFKVPMSESRRDWEQAYKEVLGL